jgi:hypothetical protein
VAGIRVGLTGGGTLRRLGLLGLGILVGFMVTDSAAGASAERTMVTGSVPCDCSDGCTF